MHDTSLLLILDKVQDIRQEFDRIIAAYEAQAISEADLRKFILVTGVAIARIRTEIEPFGDGLPPEIAEKVEGLKAMLEAADAAYRAMLEEMMDTAGDGSP